MPTALIAEDTPAQAALMKKVVTEMGFETIEVTDGEACIEAAVKSLPQIILLDVVMPKMDGFKTCRTLKKNEATKHIPIIIITTKSGDTDKFWAEKQGANAFITKPFGPDDLKAKITELALTE